MLLLTVREFLGPSMLALRAGDPPERSKHDTLRGFVTRLSLGDAMLRLRAYEDVFRAKYDRTAVNFNVVAAMAIEDLTPEQIAAGRLELVEELELGG